jgi:excisionase family DNA binding protein
MYETHQRSVRPIGPEPLQVTIRQAAALLSYDERTVRRLVARGELRAVGRGRLRRIALADLWDWQERNRS